MIFFSEYSNETIWEQFVCAEVLGRLLRCASKSHDWWSLVCLCVVSAAAVMMVIDRTCCFVIAGWSAFALYVLQCDIRFELPYWLPICVPLFYKNSYPFLIIDNTCVCMNVCVGEGLSHTISLWSTTFKFSWIPCNLLFQFYQS